MLPRGPALILLITLAVVALCAGVVLYLAFSQPLLAAAPHEAGEPGDAATALPPPSILPTAMVGPTAQPALPERRRLTLEFPSQIRVGDSERMRLTLEVDDLGNVTPTAEFGGNVVTGDVIEIPNLYETHHVIAEARFDVAGMEVVPPDLASQVLAQGQAVTFFWSIRPTATGTFSGTVWLFLRFVDRQTSEESRKAISAQLVEIDAVKVLGLPAGLARILGGVGSVVGMIIGFPFFEDVLKFLIRRRRKPVT